MISRTQAALSWWLLAVVVAALHGTACVGEQICRAATQAEFDQALARDECGAVWVMETLLTELTAQGPVERPVQISIAENTSLRSIRLTSEIRGGVSVHANGALEELEVKSWVLRATASPELRAITYATTTPPDEGDDEDAAGQFGGSGVTVTDAPKLERVSMAPCEGPCPARHGLLWEGATEAQLNALDAELLGLKRLALSPLDRLVSSEPLRKLGVPERVALVHSPQGISEMAEYEDWLRAEGFTGEFRACTEAAECAAITDVWLDPDAP
jgi:hypothetical protein